MATKDFKKSYELLDFVKLVYSFACFSCSIFLLIVGNMNLIGYQFINYETNFVLLVLCGEFLMGARHQVQVRLRLDKGCLMPWRMLFW